MHICSSFFLHSAYLKKECIWYNNNNIVNKKTIDRSRKTNVNNQFYNVNGGNHYELSSIIAAYHD